MGLFSEDPKRTGLFYLLWLRFHDWQQRQQDEDDYEDFGPALGGEVYGVLSVLAPFLIAFAVWSPIFAAALSCLVAAGGPLTFLNAIFRARYEQRAVSRSEIRTVLHRVVLFLVLGQALFAGVMMFRS